MRQLKVLKFRGAFRAGALLATLGVIITVGACDKSSGGGIGKSSSGTIVCLTPAGTNLIAAMGLTDRIVGVSSYEADPTLKRLPKVGDYLRIDWERLMSLKPGIVIVQGRRDRLPPGVRERCEDAGIAISILQIDRLSDIEINVMQLGRALNNEPAAEKLIADLKIKLSPQHPAKPTPALIVLNDSGTAVVGRDNYLNDLLEAAGGANVIDGLGYPTIDHEKMRSLKPAEVFLLIPGADEAAIATARKAIDIDAVKQGDHLHVITDADVLLPGANVVKLKQQFEAGLHARAN